MHLSTFKSLNKKNITFAAMFFIAFSLLFTSCDHFLNAEDIRNEITRVIDENNAKKVNVLIKTVEGTGSFLVEGEKEFTVGFSEEELYFTENKNTCIITGLEAVCKTNPSVSRNDCVTFSHVSYDEETGLHIIKVKVIKHADDILVQPKYILKPKVDSISPEYSDNGSPIYEPIKLTFNCSLENVTDMDGNFPFSFNNISIYCQGLNISMYFKDPVLDNDNKTIIIAPKVTELINFLISKSIDITDITVTFISSYMNFNIDNQNVQIATGDSLSYKFRYTRRNVDTTPPAITSLTLYRNYNKNNYQGTDPLNLDMSKIPQDYDEFYDLYEKNYINGYGYPLLDNDTGDVVLKEEYYDFQNEILNNRTKDGIVYIIGEFSTDTKNIQIEEEFIELEYDADFHPSSDENQITIYNQTDTDVIYWKSTSSKQIVVIEHHIKHDDGIIKLKISALDNYENSSAAQEFYVVKISTLYFGDSRLYNIYTDYCESNSDFIDGEDLVNFDMDYYNDNKKNVKLIYVNYFTSPAERLLCFEDYRFYAFYPGLKCDPTGIYTSIKCEYYDDNGVFHSEEMLPYTYTNNEPTPYGYNTDECFGAKNWNHTLKNVQNVNGKSVTITITDDIGNTGSQTYDFPEAVSLRTQNTNNISIKEIKYLPDSYGLCICKPENEDEYYGCEVYSTPFKIIDGYSYYFIPKDTLIGDLSRELTFDEQTPVLSTIELNGPITIETIPFDPTTDKQARSYINIPIKSNTWKYYNKILLRVLYSNTSGQECLVQYQFFENKEQILKVDVITSFLFGDDEQRIELYGINSNGQLSQASKYDIPLPEEEDRIIYDNQPPTIWTHNHTKEQYIELDLADYESHPNTLTGYINNIKCFEFYNSSPQYPNIDPPIVLYKALLEYFTRDSSIMLLKLVGTDYNGLQSTETIKIPIKTSEPMYIFDKTSSLWYFYTPDKLENTKIEMFDSNTKAWQTIYDITSNYGLPSGISTETWLGDTILSVPLDNSDYNIMHSFIRIKNAYSVPMYYYTELTPSEDFINSGRYDSLKQNPSSLNSFIVSSDAPVFVHTMATYIPYNECKFWSVEDWEFYKSEYGSELFNFKARNQGTYLVPVNEVKSGQCYVVIAYFADGTSQMSNVMVKE